jgi:hypothetical protein
MQNTLSFEYFSSVPSGAMIPTYLVLNIEYRLTGRMRNNHAIKMCRTSFETLMTHILHLKPDLSFFVNLTWQFYHLHAYKIYIIPIFNLKHLALRQIVTLLFFLQSNC